MRRTTAEEVADLLGVVEATLAGGRPRKPLGKSRPEAVTHFGKPIFIAKASNSDFWLMDTISLVGAFKLAVRENEYSRRVREYASLCLLMHSGLHKLIHGGKRGEPVLYNALQYLDDATVDTRELQRNIRATRKLIEENYLAGPYTSTHRRHRLGEAVELPTASGAGV